MLHYRLSDHLDCQCQKEERKIFLCVRAVKHGTLHSAALLRSLLVRVRWVPLPPALKAQCVGNMRSVPWLFGLKATTVKTGTARKLSQ